MGESSSPGLWRCKACGTLLGAMTPACRLWLDAGVVDLAQRYTNAVRVQCACGRVNVWYLSPSTMRQALDDAENL